MRRYTLSIVLATALTGQVILAAGSDEEASEVGALETVQERGTLIVGMMGTYPPYNFLNADEVMDGFDADIAREAARRIGVEAEFVPTEWSGMIEGLLRGRFDTVISQMTITPERREQMDFTQPYITNQVRIIVSSSNNDIAALEDFVGRRIGVGLGTNDEAYLRSELRPRVGDFEIVTYNDVITSLQDLSIGRTDATINNLYAIAPLVAERGFEIKAVGEPVKSDNAGIAFRKGSEDLRDAVDHALTDMKADGTYDRIFARWFAAVQ